MKWILEFPAAGEAGQVGGKAASLARLQSAGFSVPAWFVITPQALLASLTPNLLAKLSQLENPDQAAALLASVQPSPEFLADLNQAVRRLGSDLFAVRSSAIDEDNQGHSFAGQLESYLNVPPSAVAAKIVQVWQSAFTPRVWIYRREQGLPLKPSAPAVIVQRMVQANAAGVAFSADPVSGRRGVAVISAVRGCGSALLSGQVSGDTYHVDHTGRLTLHNLTAPEPVLRDDEVREVARLARAVAAHAGTPQDIEWAFQNGTLHLLQARPITTLRDVPDPDGEWRLWDNSNIVESYGGMTAPLTYSFARHAYEGVYRQFCRIMHVPAPLVASHDDTFCNMIGYIHGRVYYNLTNWYRVLALLPGYKINRPFMEQMMGVRERGQEAGVRDQGSGVRGQTSEDRGQRTEVGERFWDLLHLVRTVVGLIWNYLTLPRQVRLFLNRLHRALVAPDPPLEQMRPDELVGHYRTLERQLLTRWDAPLVNDFFAMIFHGVLRRLCEKWCQSAGGALANELIRHQGGLISAEPAAWLSRLAKLAEPHPALRQALQSGNCDQIEKEMRSVPPFENQLREYLNKFGERCLEELKLESPTLIDDPLPLYRSIGALATRSEELTSSSLAVPKRGSTENRILSDRPFRAALFRWVLRNARDRVRDRENLRFERTRLFGRIRRIFTELGRRFQADGHLDDPRQIFFLEIDEAIGFCEGTATCTDLKALASVRRRQFERWKTEPAPPNRFESRGAVNHGLASQVRVPDAVPSASTHGSDTRVGQGCCPGKVRGKVRVITDPRQADLRPGEILVAERTDPGWVLLFPAAAGLLVERGSLLSHSAIVARELGLPTVIGITGLMDWLKSGDDIELDGTTGEVRRWPAAGSAAAGT